jgi:hypothetical protein
MSPNSREDEDRHLLGLNIVLSILYHSEVYESEGSTDVMLSSVLDKSFSFFASFHGSRQPSDSRLCYISIIISPYLCANVWRVSALLRCHSPDLGFGINFGAQPQLPAHVSAQSAVLIIDRLTPGLMLSLKEHARSICSEYQNYHIYTHGLITQ